MDLYFPLKIIILIKYYIISFFKSNNGLSFIILEFEIIYNYIILLYDSNYLLIEKTKNREFYKLM